VSVPDLDARRRALTDFESNILVEAAAGTGKTSLMAARVAMMIATGIDPTKIAAITPSPRRASSRRGYAGRSTSSAMEGCRLHSPGFSRCP